MQKNMNNIQMKSKQIEGHHYVACECVHESPTRFSWFGFAHVG